MTEKKNALEHVWRFLHARFCAINWLLRLDLIVSECLKLPFVILVGELLIFLNDLRHIYLATSGNIVRRSNIHDPNTVSLCSCSHISIIAWCSISALRFFRKAMSYLPASAGNTSRTQGISYQRAPVAWCSRTAPYPRLLALSCVRADRFVPSICLVGQRLLD